MGTKRSSESAVVREHGLRCVACGTRDRIGTLANLMSTRPARAEKATSSHRVARVAVMLGCMGAGRTQDRALGCRWVSRAPPPPENAIGRLLLLSFSCSRVRCAVLCAVALPPVLCSRAFTRLSSTAGPALGTTFFPRVSRLYVRLWMLCTRRLKCAGFVCCVDLARALSLSLSHFLLSACPADCVSVGFVAVAVRC